MAEADGFRLEKLLKIHAVWQMDHEGGNADYGAIALAMARDETS